MERAVPFVAVFVGGAIGSAARFVIQVGLGNDLLALVVVNAVGSFALGVLAGAVFERVRAWMRAGLGAGLLGGFTTLSGASLLPVVAGGTPGGVGTASALVMAAACLGMAALCFAVAWLGLLLGRSGRRAPEVHG